MKTRFKNFLLKPFLARRQSEEKYRVSFEEASDAMLISDSTGNILDSNRSATQLFGYSSRELAGMHITDLYFRGELQERSLQYKDLLTTTAIRAERTIVRKSDRHVSVEVTVKLLPDGRFMAILRDISERKKTEQELKAAVERYDILAQATSDTIWDWDIAGNTKLYNPGLTKMFGYDSCSIDNASKWLNEKIHPEDLPMVVESFQHVITNKLQHLLLEYRFQCADGSYKNIFDRSFVIYDSDKNPVRMIGSMQDITQTRNEEKRVEKAIIEAQEKERLHIGQELHDNINQILASAHMTLSSAKDYFPDVARTNRLINISRERIEEALLEIRKLSHQLAPAVADGALLKDLFLELFNSVDVRGRFKIDFHFDNRLNDLADETLMLNLYRIMQEQLKNIVKYAQPEHILVILRMHEKNIFFTIRDDGQGFDLHTAKKGIGLNNIRKRVESLCGRFTLKTAPGEGCQLTAEIPF
jgi:two-component system sensor histidine kinase UhpB